MLLPKNASSPGAPLSARNLAGTPKRINISDGLCVGPCVGLKTVNQHSKYRFKYRFQKPFKI